MSSPATGAPRPVLKLLLLFFLLMLVFPTTYRLGRGVLLAVLLIAACVYLLMGGRWRVDRTIFAWSIVTVAAGLLFMWNGAMQGAPGVISVATVHVIWPLLYLFFIGFLREPATLVDLQKVIVVGVLLSAVLGILLVVGTLAGYGKQLADTFVVNDVAAGMYDGFARYRMSNIPTVVYGTGFLLALICVPRAARWCSRAWTLLAWSTLLPMLVAVILSGRRAAWLVVLVMPFIIFGLLLLARQPLRMRLWLALAALGVGAAIGVLAYFNLEASSITREFVHAFDFAAEKSAGVRGAQAEALFAGWAERPLLGHGLGAAATVVRSLDQPWAYELSYAALLFHTGVIGVTIYGAAVLWVFWAGIHIVRRMPESATILLPLLAGLAGFLIANGTNPYLAKFDYLWVIFLPIAAIKVYLVRLRSPSARPAQLGSHG
jgi:hypothetical protein